VVNARSWPISDRSTSDRPVAYTSVRSAIARAPTTSDIPAVRVVWAARDAAVLMLV